MCVWTGRLGGEPPHVQETQVEAGRSWKARFIKKRKKTSQMTQIKAFKSIMRVLCRLQGQLGNLEPAQDDVSAPAVLRPAGQRGGTAALPWVCVFPRVRPERVRVSSRRVWCRTATRCTPATCSSRTSITTCPTTPETRRCSVDAMWTSSSCGSCGEQRWGLARSLRPSEGTLPCF